MNPRLRARRARAPWSRRRCRRRACPSSIARPTETPRKVITRLLVAGEQPRDEAVAPLDLAEEGLAVLGVAHRARRDGEHPFGAEPLGVAPVVDEQLRTRAIGSGKQPAAPVDALAEPVIRRAARSSSGSPSTSATRAASCSCPGRPLRRGSLARDVRSRRVERASAPRPPRRSARACGPASGGGPAAPEARQLAPRAGHALLRLGRVARDVLELREHAASASAQLAGQTAEPLGSPPRRHCHRDRERRKTPSAIQILRQPELSAGRSRYTGGATRGGAVR